MEARAELEVLRARREAELLHTARQQEVVDAARAAYAEYVRSEAQRRLENLKVYGQSLAADVPAEWRALVVRDLNTYVAAEQFPSTVTDWDARRFIEARVTRILMPYWDGLARNNERSRRQRLRQALLESGNGYARLETVLWEGTDAQEVREEIREELERTVRWDWTDEHVRRLVDGILDEWEEDDEEGDDED